MTGAWWDTGALETTAADLVTVQGAAILSQETVPAGECTQFLLSSLCISDSFGDPVVISKVSHAVSAAKLLADSVKNHLSSYRLK